MFLSRPRFFSLEMFRKFPPLFFLAFFPLFSCINSEVELDVGDSDSHYHLGIEFAQYSLFQNAIDEFDLALKYNPDNVKAYNKKGLVLFGIGEYGKAKQAFEKVISIRPDYVQAHINLGMVSYVEGDQAKALQHWEESVGISSNDKDAKAYNNIANIYNNEKNFTRAIEYYQKALDEDPINSLYLNNLAETYRLNGDLVQAGKVLKRSLISNPKGMLTHFNLGKLYKVQKKNKESIKAFNQSLSINPGLLDAYFEIAEIQFDGHDKIAAKETIEKALSRDPNNSKFKALLARIQSS